MAIVIMKGWQEGLEKVSPSKLQTDILKLPLKQAKANVDALLDGWEVRFEISDETVARKFFYEVKQIGIEASLDFQP
jgi:hypothetical protein